MGFTPRGIWFPDDQASTRIWELMQQQAESVDGVIAQRDDRLDKGTPTWIFRRSTDQPGIASSTNTTVRGMSLVTVDSSAEDVTDYVSYDGTSGLFTVVRAGRYRLRGVATWPQGGVFSCLSTLKVDGVDVDVVWGSTSGAYTAKTAAVADSVYLEAGDVFRLDVAHAAGSNQSIKGSATEHRIGMSIAYLGEV